MLESKANEDELLMSKKNRRGENSFLSTFETLLRSLDDERLNYLIVLLHWMTVASISLICILVRTKAWRVNDFLWTSRAPRISFYISL